VGKGDEIGNDRDEEHALVDSGSGIVSFTPRDSTQWGWVPFPENRGTGNSGGSGRGGDREREKGREGREGGRKHPGESVRGGSGKWGPGAGAGAGRGRGRGEWRGKVKVGRSEGHRRAERGRRRGKECHQGCAAYTLAHAKGGGSLQGGSSAAAQEGNTGTMNNQFQTSSQTATSSGSGSVSQSNSQSQSFSFSPTTTSPAPAASPPPTPRPCLRNYPPLGQTPFSGERACSLCL